MMVCPLSPTPQDLADGGAGHLLLKESDFISLLDQFPFTDLFQYVLCLSPHSTGEGVRV